MCLKQLLPSVHLSRVFQELCRRFLEASWRHGSSGLSLSQFVLFLHVIPDRLMIIRSLCGAIKPHWIITINGKMNVWNVN